MNITIKPPQVTLTARDLYHFLASAVAAYGALWIYAGKPTDKNGLLALIPGAAAVLFRQVFPTAGNVQPQEVPSLDPTSPPSGGAA